MQKTAGRPLPDIFLFLKKASYEEKQVVFTLISFYFETSRLRHTKKSIKL